MCAIIGRKNKIALKTNMPLHIYEIYVEIWQEVVWVHSKWNIFLQLYSDSETIALLNNTAPSYFRICQDVLLDDIMLSICRLTDPAQTGGKTNLSLRRLVDNIEANKNDKLKDIVKKILDLAEPNFEFARDHRNRRIAHNDLQTRMKTHLEPLSSYTNDKVNDALKNIGNVMNVVQHHYESSETLYSHCISPDDGNDLLYWLRKGYDKHED